MTQPLTPEIGGTSAVADEPMQPTVEGFRVVRWLGSGAAADVWLVADEHSGTEYALKLPRQPDEAGGSLDAVEGEAERERLLLESAAHEHLLAVLRIVPSGTGPGLLLQFAAGGSVAALVAARGPLSVAESVTVLTPIAQALAYLHARGVTHGDVSPGNVLFTEHGKPLLSDFGIARVVGSERRPSGGTPGFVAPEALRRVPGHGPSPEGDVYALAALGWYMLTGRVPARTAKRPPLAVMVANVPVPLVELLEAGLSEQPSERPSAEEFGRRAYRAARAEPVDLAPAVHPSIAPKLLTRRVARGRDGALALSARLRPRSAGRSEGKAGAAGRRPRHKNPAAGAMLPPGRRKRYPTVVGAAVLAAAIAVAVLAGSAIAGPDQQEPAAAPTRPAASASAAAAPEGYPALPEDYAKALRGDNPGAAVEALTWLRTEALQRRDAGLLTEVNAEGSPAMTADLAVIAALEEHDHHFTGLSARVSKPAVLERAAGKAQVAATVTTSPYEQRDSTGIVVASADKAKVQHVMLLLVREHGRWLIDAVHDPPR